MERLSKEAHRARWTIEAEIHAFADDGNEDGLKAVRRHLEELIDLIDLCETSLGASTRLEHRIEQAEARATSQS